MYFAIKDAGKIKVSEINGSIENEFTTYNEFKIIKTKLNGLVKVYLLMFNEVTDAKSLILSHGGMYDKNRLIISDSIDSREYKLDGVITKTNYDGTEDEIVMSAEKCKFVEFPLIDEILKVRYDEITQFVSCLEILPDNNGRYIEFYKK